MAADSEFVLDCTDCGKMFFFATWDERQADFERNHTTHEVEMLCPHHLGMTLFECKKLHEDATPSITCPKCDKTSYSPHDIEDGYCSNCKDWTSDV